MIDNRNHMNERPGADGINNFFFPPPPHPPHPPHPHHPHPPYHGYGPYYPHCGGGRSCYPKRHPWRRRYYNPYRRPW